MTRRPWLAGSVSVALHGGALGLAALVIEPNAGQIAPMTEQTARTEIEVVEPPPPQAPESSPPVSTANAGAQPAAPGAGADVRGRVGREGHRRSPSRAPVVADPYADLQVSYEAPIGPEPGDGIAATGSGLGAALTGIGLGTGGDRAGGGDGLVIPPPPVSHASPPRPRRYYSYWKFQGSRWLIGQTFRATLLVDARGLVREVRLVDHMNSWLDQQAIDLARTFVFYPALDDAGRPTAGSFPWRFQMIR